VRFSDGRDTSHDLGDSSTELPRHCRRSAVARSPAGFAVSSDRETGGEFRALPLFVISLVNGRQIPIAISSAASSCFPVIAANRELGTLDVTGYSEILIILIIVIATRSPSRLIDRTSIDPGFKRCFISQEKQESIAREKQNNRILDNDTGG